MPLDKGTLHSSRQGLGSFSPSNSGLGNNAKISFGGKSIAPYSSIDGHREGR